MNRQQHNRFASAYALLPPDGHLAVPMSSRRAAKAGLSMYTACKRSSSFAQRAAWHAITVFGPRILPGRRQGFRPPVDQAVWTELVDRWRQDFGVFDSIAFHLRRPAHRAGASLLLLHRDAPIAFVKLRANHERLERERLVLDTLTNARTCFLAPNVLGADAVRGWHYLGLSALPVKIHTVAADPPLHRIVDSVAVALAQTLRRPPDAGVDWQPMHGDLTPWNLRTLARNRIVLFDWGGADWGPPQADLLWYDSVVDVAKLSLRRSGVRHTTTAVEYWIDRLAQEVKPGDDGLAATILRRLRNSWRP